MIKKKKMKISQEEEEFRAIFNETIKLTKALTKEANKYMNALEFYANGNWDQGKKARKAFGLK